jgi:hypothetical protein
MLNSEGRSYKVLQENFHKDGKLRSRFDLIDREVETVRKNQVVIGKHWLVLGALALSAIALIFAAALIVVYYAERPANYFESCASRSCLSSLNMKCINKTCVCTSDQYYTKKCIDKKGYLEKCVSLTTHCQNNLNLVCQDGICKCSDNYYWTGSKCSAKVSYSKSCASDDQCYSDKMMVCNVTTKKCSCPSDR